MDLDPTCRANSAMSVADEAFVTLATNDENGQGALVLGQSLRLHGTSRKMAVLVTPQVSRVLRILLSWVFDDVVNVDLRDSREDAHLVLLHRPKLDVALWKLQCWTLMQYRKCVFLDADMPVLCRVDELFEREELLAAPDPGWPDCFNSGIFVFRPSLHMYQCLLHHAAEHGSFDGSDQGLLNSFFSNWASADICKRLPFTYNLSASTVYTYSPAFSPFLSSAKVVHFVGPAKPWSCCPESGLDPGVGAFLALWGRLHHSHVRPLFARLQSVCVNDFSVSCANPAAKAREPGANSALGPEVPCANPAMVHSTLEPVLGEALLSLKQVRLPDVDFPPGSTRGSSPQNDVIGAHAVEVDLSIYLSETSLAGQSELVDLEAEAEADRRKWEEGCIDYLGKDPGEAGQIPAVTPVHPLHVLSTAMSLH